jgi:two-component system, sensor histidine kinase RegB
MTPVSDSSTSQALLVGLDRWLRVRWWMVPCQIAAIAAAGPLPPSVPIWLLAGLSVMAMLPGIFAGKWRRVESARTMLSALILGDLVLLTVALGLCGGPSNPFTVLYLVYLTLACVLLGPKHGWTATGVAAGLYALLFLLSPASGNASHAHVHGAASDLRQHLWSMYFAFIAVSALVVTFVSSVMRTLRAREADLVEAWARADRNERLANITVLAAGTAHEMGTPLATIAVTAKELERAAVQVQQDQWADDARLIRSEVDRCRRLLDELRGHAGAVEGEAPSPIRLDEALGAATSELPNSMRERIAITPTAETVKVFLPRTAFVQVLGNLVRNAIEASQPDKPIVIDASSGGGVVAVSVRDQGHGMDASTLARAREPFFTTKPPGAGLGLGLFLADRFAKDVGGALQLRSTLGQGTEVRLELPG